MKKLSLDADWFPSTSLWKVWNNLWEFTITSDWDKRWRNFETSNFNILKEKFMSIYENDNILLIISYITRISLIILIIFLIWLFIKLKNKRKNKANIKEKVSYINEKENSIEISLSSSFKLTKKDHIKFMIYNFFHKSHIIPVMISIFWAFSMFGEWYIPISHILWIIFPSMLVITHLFEFVFYFLVSLLRKEKKYDIKISSEEIKTKEWEIENKYNWESFVERSKTFLRTRENKNYFFLYTGFSKAIVIPKRAFKIEKDIKEFKNFLVEKKILNK